MANIAQCNRSPHPIVEDSELGHAVGSTELLQPASVVTVQHLLADAVAVGARAPRMILVARCQVLLEKLLTAWNRGRAVRYSTYFLLQRQE